MTNKEQATRRLGIAEVTTLLDAHFPQLNAPGKLFLIEDLAPGRASLRLRYGDHLLRPGGTISGPAMFTLADVAVYVVLLADRGEAALQAVTTSLNINFLSRPGPGDLIAHARLLKAGRRLSVGEVDIISAATTDMVGHATATYAMPPEK